MALRALGLGDLLAGVPALRALRRAFPDHHRVLCAPARLAPLLPMIGAVDELRPTAGLVDLDPSLRRPALAVDLHGRGPGSQPKLLALGPRRLVAFAHPAVAGTEHGPRWRPGEHEVLRWCRLLEESGIPADPGDLGLAPPPLPAGLAARVTGADLVHPGAAFPARRWPPGRFAAVARALAAEGRTVVVTAGPGERRLARSVAERAGLGAEAVVSDLPPDRLVGVVAAAARLLCGDTGVAHVATATATPSVVLFGPVPPAEWGPRAGPHRALWAGRRGDPHGATVDPGLLEIGVPDVLAALAGLAPPVNAAGGRRARR